MYNSEFCYIIVRCFREHVGGTRFAKKNFTANFGVDVQDGPIAGLPVDIMMHIAV